MNRILIGFVVVALAAVTVHAEDKKPTETQLLTAQVLRLKAQVGDLQQQLATVQSRGNTAQVYLEALQAVVPHLVAVKAPAPDASIEAEWKALEASLRSTLKPDAAAVFDRDTLTFTEPK